MHEGWSPPWFDIYLSTEELVIAYRGIIHPQQEQQQQSNISLNPQYDCHCCCIGVQPPAQDSLSIIVDTSDSDTFCLLPETPAATRRRSDDFSSSCEGDVFVVFVRALRPPCPSPMRFVHALRPCSSSVCFILRLWHYRHHLHRLHCGIAAQN